MRSLVSEMNAVDGPNGEPEPAARTEAVIAETANTIYEDATLSIDEGLVKESLPELLTALIKLRTGETHGKGVMEDLARFFGADLSPGTVYPELHELKEEGVLSVHELVQTKEYSVEDVDAARETVEAGMAQHLALGLVFHRALGELEEDDAETEVEL